jgi:GGDEF domain-containing protein
MSLARVANDLEARKRFELQLAHQTFHDLLTRLPNRALFTNRAEHALIRAGNKKRPMRLSATTKATKSSLDTVAMTTLLDSPHATGQSPFAAAAF